MSQSTMPRSELALLGFAAAVSQAVLLREAMAATAGSEIAWGTVLALWLLGVGAGAAVGVRLRRASCLGGAAVLLSSGAGVVLLRAVPALAGAAPGEVLGSWQTAGAWTLAVLPPAGLVGVVFSRLAAELRGERSAGAAYAVESCGALVGGLAFTFVLAPRGGAVVLVVSSALIVAATLAGKGRHLMALAVLALGAVTAGPADHALAHATWRWAARPGELAHWRETRAQRLEVSTGSPAAVYADGALLGVFPDPYRTGPRSHLLMLLHPSPRRVLAVGAVASGSLPALLEHPVERLDVVEDDPALLEILPGWWKPEMQDAMADARVVSHRGDPLRVIRAGGPWDLVLLLDPDPSTVRHNRTRTRELFASCAQRLTADGVLVVRVGVSDTYLGGAGGRLLDVLAATLRSAFPVVVGIPGDEVLLVATRGEGPASLDPGVLAERWRQREIVDGHFAPEMLALLLDPGREAALAAFVGAGGRAVNRIAEPRAVLAAASLAEGRASPPFLGLLQSLSEGRRGWLLVMPLAIVLLLLVARGAAGCGVMAGVVVGFSSMAWWLLLLLAWQATLGSVYAEIGALSAAFMAGLVTGVAAVRRWVGQSVRALPWLLTGCAALSLLLAATPQLSWPRSTVVPLLLLAGALTGAAFPGVAELAGGGIQGRGAGRGFAADEVGAGLAAVLVGVLAVPLVGMRTVAVGLAVMQVLAAGLVATVGRAARRSGRKGSHG